MTTVDGAAEATTVVHREAAIDEELLALETGALDPAKFPHPEHVRLGFEMLERYPFSEALTRFARGLRLLAAKGGRPEVYHETITVAFLAVIAERRAGAPHADWSEFKANNGDLLDKRCLERWYETDQLRSDLARRTFACRDRALLSVRDSPPPPVRHRISPAWPGTLRKAGWRHSRLGRW